MNNKELALTFILTTLGALLFLAIYPNKIEAILVGILVMGIQTAIMQIEAEKRSGVVYRDNGVNPYNYLFRPMPEGTFSADQPYKRAFAWLGALVVLMGFGWIAVNVPPLTTLAMIYMGMGLIVMVVVLVEDISPTKSDITACMLWGYGHYEDQILLGLVIAIPFVLLNFVGEVALQIENMPVASFILTVIMIPMVEEALFRGVIAASIAEDAGIVHGAIFSAFIFAMFHAYAYHLDWLKIFIAFAFGVVVALADFKYKSILPGVVAHMAVNFSAYLVWLTH